MMRILLVDDEPLVLIGLQGMLNWEALGFEICGTARNGKLALDLIEREQPDIVIADVKMPVMDGLELAEACHAKGPLPAFIMLTSFEEFRYVRQAMGAGAVDYLVKLELSEETLAAALHRAAALVTKEQSLRRADSDRDGGAGFLVFRDRLLARLYSGVLKDEKELAQRTAKLNMPLSAPAYLVASCDITTANAGLTAEQLIRLSFSTVRMVEGTLEKYLPCYATSMDVQRFNVLFCLNDEQAADSEALLTPLLEKTNQIIYNYFSVGLLWAVARPTADLLSLSRRCRENDYLRPLLCEETPLIFSHAGREDDPTERKARIVEQVQNYIRTHLSDRLSLNDVAAVFNFSPNYLSQLFAKYGDSGFVGYVTEMRIAAAKELLEQGDLKIYEIADRLGFESAFYFSKVFKKVTGYSPREYQQQL